MTKQEKQITTLLKDKKYLLGFFNKRVKDINPDALHVVDLKSYFIKEHIDENFFHFVIQNNLRLETKKGLRERYKIFCASFSGHGRRKMYKILELVYKNGFDRGEVIVPHPLWYVDEIMSAFYIGVPGDNLLEHIKNGYLNYSTISQIGEGLSKFHKINFEAAKIKLQRHEFSLHFLDPTNILARDYNYDRMHEKIIEQSKKLQELYLILSPKMELHLSHGDFHPENVIINQYESSQLAIIDFSEACLAPIYYDIASFLEQMEFMTLKYISPSAYSELEKTYLFGYFKKQPITPEIMQYINLYKSWTALKSTVYFMIFEDEENRKFARYLLGKSREFYDKAS